MSWWQEEKKNPNKQTNKKQPQHVKGIVSVRNRNNRQEELHDLTKWINGSRRSTLKDKIFFWNLEPHYRIAAVEEWENYSCCRESSMTQVRKETDLPVSRKIHGREHKWSFAIYIQPGCLTLCRTTLVNTWKRKHDLNSASCSKFTLEEV